MDQTDQEQADHKPAQRLWEGSWADNAIDPDPENDSYADPDKIRTIHHHGQYYDLDTRHIVDPSPQRTPFLFQAGTPPAGSAFAAAHAEAIFASSHSPAVLRPKVAKIRELAAEMGRDPRSVKFFATFTPIIGRTDEEAREKYEELKKYASVVGGLVLFSGWTGIDISKIPLDQEITAADSLEAHKVRSILDSFTATSKEVPRWTPRVVAERACIGGLGPVSVDGAQTVADELEAWVREADVDGFDLGYVTTPPPTPRHVRGGHRPAGPRAEEAQAVPGAAGGGGAAHGPGEDLRQGPEGPAGRPHREQVQVRCLPGGEGAEEERGCNRVTAPGELMVGLTASGEGGVSVAYSMSAITNTTIRQYERVSEY